MPIDGVGEWCNLFDRERLYHVDGKYEGAWEGGKRHGTKVYSFCLKHGHTGF